MILNLILWIPEKIQIGVINVVSNINRIEIPSIPNWKVIKPSIQFLFSINWKSETVLSNKTHKKIERKKFAIDIKIATCLEFFSTFFSLPLVIKINKAPIIGNVCMDMCMLDISNIDVEEGDEVIVFGKGFPIQKFAKLMDTIPYEALTGISPRVKRVYYQE